MSPGDVLEELGLSLPAADPGAVPRGSVLNPPVRALPSDLDPLERTLWESLAVEPRHVDQLVAAASQLGIKLYFELTAPAHVDLTSVNEVLREIGASVVSADDLAPLHAA